MGYGECDTTRRDSSSTNLVCLVIQASLGSKDPLPKKVRLHLVSHLLLVKVLEYKIEFYTHLTILSISVLVLQV